MAKGPKATGGSNIGNSTPAKAPQTGSPAGNKPAGQTGSNPALAKPGGAPVGTRGVAQPGGRPISERPVHRWIPNSAKTPDRRENGPQLPTRSPATAPPPPANTLPPQQGTPSLVKVRRTN